MFSFEEKSKHLRLADLHESNMRIPKVGNGTLEDLRNALRDAVKSLFPGSYPIIISTYEDRVIIEIEQQGKTLLFEIPYEVLKGSITLGTPIQVQKKVSYTKTETRTGMSVQDHWLTEKQKKRQQRLAGVGGYDQKGLNEEKDGRVELRECLFDSGLTVLNKDLLLEGKTGIIKISGRAAKAGAITGNRRLYPKEVFEKQIKALQNNITAGKFLGELDHPMPVGAHGRLSQTAIKYTKLGLDGDYLVFEGDVLPTPAGEVLKSLLKSNVTVGISTRGFGATKKETINGDEYEVIQDDYELVAIDAVTDPASKDAEIQNFM
jgi:hypothetical protein